MPKKPRKAPAKAPVIRNRVEPDLGEEAAGENDEPLRFDPDQPPITGITGRPSVYSEWINSSPRPSVYSAWLNSPAPAAPAAAAAPLVAPEPAVAPVAPPAPTATRRPRAADRAGASSRQDAASEDAVAQPAPGKGRSRRATSARRLSAAERLSVNVETLEALSADAAFTGARVPRPSPDAGEAEMGHVADISAHQVAPTVRRRPRAAPAPTTPAMPATPPAALITPAAQDIPASPPARATGARLPATLGETARRTAIPAGSAGARTSPPRPYPQPEISGRVGVSRAARARPDNGLAAGARRGDLEEEMALSIRETAHLPAVSEESDFPAEASVLIRGTGRPVRTTTGRIVPRRMRPPSIIAQAVVALVTVIVLMGALAISSPLGYGAAISGTFQAYANAVAWIPTPTPTATPTPVPRTYQSVPASPGTQAIINEIKSIFGQYAQGALNVSHCESGWDPAARNPYPVGNSHAEGVFQILYPSTWDTTSYASRSPYDYDANIRAAWEIFSRDGYSWREWECKPY